MCLSRALSASALFLSPRQSFDLWRRRPRKILGCPCCRTSKHRVEPRSSFEHTFLTDTNARMARPPIGMKAPDPASRARAIARSRIFAFEGLVKKREGRVGTVLPSEGVARNGLWGHYGHSIKHLYRHLIVIGVQRVRVNKIKQGPSSQFAERAGSGLRAFLQQQGAAWAECTCAGAHMGIIPTTALLPKL